MQSLLQYMPLLCDICSTCNLASQFLDSDFSRQVRAHDFTEKIIAVLQDTLDIQVSGCSGWGKGCGYKHVIMGVARL